MWTKRATTAVKVVSEVRKGRVREAAAARTSAGTSTGTGASSRNNSDANEGRRRQQQGVIMRASSSDDKENMPCTSHQPASSLLLDECAEVEKKSKKGKGKSKKKFYGCYLLVSLGARAKGRTYIGFTVKPKRRIRQHNGELAMGASRTRMGRPWEMVLVVYGFSSQGRALAFEWAWQHPRRSKSIRDQIAKMKSGQLSGVKGKARILRELLSSEAFQNERLKVQILDSKYASPVHPLLSNISRKEGDGEGGLPVSIAPLASLPDSNEPLAEDSDDSEETEEETEESQIGSGYNTKCMLCFQDLIEGCVSLSCRCESRFHPSCLENHFAKKSEKKTDGGVSVSASASDQQCDQGPCPLCGYELTWEEALALGRERDKEDEEENDDDDEGDHQSPVKSSSSLTITKPSGDDEVISILSNDESEEEEILSLEERLKQRKRSRERNQKTPTTKTEGKKSNRNRNHTTHGDGGGVLRDKQAGRVLTPKKKKKAPPAKKKAPPVEIISLISPTK